MSPPMKATCGKSEPVVYEIQAKPSHLLGPLTLRVMTTTLLVTSVFSRLWALRITDWIISAMVFETKRQLS